MGHTFAQGSDKGFQKLSDSITFYQPSLQHASTTSVSLVVLCTWMGASPKHIMKYAEAYRQHFPHASLLVVQSALPDLIYISEQVQQKRLGSACDIILNQGQGQVLLHSFSNGGANTACQLATAISHKKPRWSGFSGVVLDSSPGQTQGNYARSAKAVSVPLQKSNPLILFLGTMAVHALLIALYILENVFGVPNAITQARGRLNNETLFDWNAPRLYLYSKADEMVWWKDVHLHAEEARQRGYGNVREIVFEKSAHCAHVMEDGSGYWTEVEKVVEDFKQRA